MRGFTPRSAHFTVSIATLLVLFTTTSLVKCGCSGTAITGDGQSDSTLTDPSNEFPVADLGESGWRDSDDPLCPYESLLWWGYDVWSDSRGVFVLLEYSNSIVDGSGQAVYLNAGSGWQVYAERSGISDVSCMNAFSGIMGGELLGWDDRNHRCNVSTVTEGNIATSVSGLVAKALFPVGSLYALALPMEGEGILKYEDASWGPLPIDPPPYSANVIWANDTVIYLAGDNGIVQKYQDDSWIVFDTRTIDDFCTLWVVNDNDIWASTFQGALFHYLDGLWYDVVWPSFVSGWPDSQCDDNVIRNIWGSDDVVYFSTSHQLISTIDSALVTIGYWPNHYISVGEGGNCIGGLTIGGIWGNSSSELFIVFASAEEYFNSDCGDKFILWWDGNEYHWF